VDEVIENTSLPPLRNPVMIAAFAGWNDAADAASGAVEHLEVEWEAVEIGHLDPENYYDFQVNRPNIEINESGARTIDWPTTRLSVVRLPAADRDVVLVRGIEPSMRWRSFSQELIDAARALKIELVITLGALLADTPHTRPVPVTGVAADAEVAGSLSIELSRYEGPTGIVGVLQESCTRAGLPAISFWAAVPHYVSQAPCPKATLALLRSVEDLTDIAIPLGELAEEARAWQHGVDELASEDADVADYVRQLEEQRDATELPEASGEAIAREFERYLKRRGEPDA
jgi:proteasome assembly chaperone (PAC2) family protein